MITGDGDGAGATGRRDEGTNYLNFTLQVRQTQRCVPKPPRLGSRATIGQEREWGKRDRSSWGGGRVR